MRVSDKYGVLERMRLALDGLYAADREAYDGAKGLLRPNTWDAHDLVPHEDTDCRTMRLVARTAHTAFKRRGGVAGAVNVKSRLCYC